MHRCPRAVRAGMADIDFDDYVDVSPSLDTSGAVASAVNWVGAIVSLGLVAGVAVWGYQLVMRDANGVPVVRALEGPMRVAPDDPGGRLADHMGLAVNQVASEGEAAAPADRRVLAPRPVALAESDKPLSELRPVARLAPVETPQQTSIEEASQPATSITAPTPVELLPNDTTIAAPEPVLAAVEPVETTAPVPAILTTPSGARIIAASVPGPSRSSRPSSRPNCSCSSARPCTAASSRPSSRPSSTRALWPASAPPCIARDTAASTTGPSSAASWSAAEGSWSAAEGSWSAAEGSWSAAVGCRSAADGGAWTANSSSAERTGASHLRMMLVSVRATGCPVSGTVPTYSV